ncbi:MAG TPA: phospholipase D-like domain-containing protein [Thermoanaerobaculia bacterium]
MRESARRGLELLADDKFSRGNAVSIMRDRQIFFGSMFQALARARLSISIEMYAIWDGYVGTQLVDLLCDRARTGVETRIIIDGIGSRALSRTSLQRLRSSGATVVVHHPPSLRGMQRVFRRTHRKLVIVDADAAFVGGFNFIDQFIGVPWGHEPWFDYVVQFSGPAVARACASFEVSWKAKAPPSLARRTAAGSPRRRGPYDLLLINSPVETGRHTVAKMQEHVLASARKRMWLRNPFLLPARHLVKTFADAVDRGVDIRVIVPGERSPHRLMLHANRHKYAALHAAGVVIYEYQPAMMHAKTAVLDGRFVLIGSANADPRSAKWNEELTLVMDAAPLAREEEQSFEQDLLACVQVHRNRVRGRLIETIAGMAERYL